jgi:hypothetical protein
MTFRFTFNAMHLARLRGALRPERKSGGFKGCPAGAPRSGAELHKPGSSQGAEASGLEPDARAGISPRNSKPLVLDFVSKGFSANMSGQHPSCRGLSRTTVKPLEQRARLRPARRGMNNMEARSSLSRVLPARRHLVKQARLDEAAGGGPLGRRAATPP